MLKKQGRRFKEKSLPPLDDKAKFGNAIVEIVEREHWGPNFDAYYEVWIRSRSSRIEKFFDDKLFNLQLEQGVAVLAQIKEADDYRERSHIKVATNPRKHSKNGKLAGLHA